MHLQGILLTLLGHASILDLDPGSLVNLNDATNPIKSIQSSIEKATKILSRKTTPGPYNNIQQSTPPRKQHGTTLSPQSSPITASNPTMIEKHQPTDTWHTVGTERTKSTGKRSSQDRSPSTPTKTDGTDFKRVSQEATPRRLTFFTRQNHRPDTPPNNHFASLDPGTDLNDDGSPEDQ